MSLTTIINDVIQTRHENTTKFILSSGLTSNIYYDLRLLYSKPQSLMNIAKYICREYISQDNIKNLRICGVPYGAIPLATACSIISEIPMIMLRKQSKDHGKGLLIEGEWNPDDNVVLIDDVLVSGKSIQNAQKQLQSQGLNVYKRIVVLHRDTIAFENQMNILSVIKEKDIIQG